MKKNNYKILERNFFCKQGEIDIIAQDKKEIVFVEVKTRSNTNFGKPSEAVNLIKQSHMYKTAMYFLFKNNYLERFIRFDVVEIVVRNEQVNVNHIKQIM